MIPANFFFFWSGEDFQFVNYLCVLSLLKTNKIKTCSVYYESPPKNNVNWEKLKKTSRVKMVKLDWEKLIEKTVISKKVLQKILARSAVNHKSDLFRYLILYQQGGVYLDFDVLVVRDFNKLLKKTFFVGKQSQDYSFSLNVGILGAEKKSKIIKKLLEKIVKLILFEEKIEWGTFGPDLLSGVLLNRPGRLFTKIAEIEKQLNFYLKREVIDFRMEKFLLKTDLEFERKKLLICPLRSFYYINWKNWQKIFEKTKLPKSSYAIHFWQSHARDFTRKLNEKEIKQKKGLFFETARKYLA